MSMLPIIRNLARFRRHRPPLSKLKIPNEVRNPSSFDGCNYERERIPPSSE